MRTAKANDIRDFGKFKKIDFTKDELYEIEKLFDLKAGEVTGFLAFFLKQLNEASPIDGKDKESTGKKVFQESFQTYDMYRSISNKCKLKRE